MQKQAAIAAHERYSHVADALRKEGYNPMWQQKVRGVGIIECWGANSGPIILVQTYERTADIEVYRPLTDSMLLSELDREISNLRQKDAAPERGAAIENGVPTLADF